MAYTVCFPRSRFPKAAQITQDSSWSRASITSMLGGTSRRRLVMGIDYDYVHGHEGGGPVHRVGTDGIMYGSSDTG